jgi:predicted flap endonuclease-1-like 5' DNA nuclease
MRSDYALYVVAIICFILATIVFAGSTDYAGYLVMEPLISMVTTAVLAVLALISAGAGYLVRPEEMVSPPPTRPPAPKPSTLLPVATPKTTTNPPIEITEVKGIGPKRAERLRTLGIDTAQDLAKSSATLLAADMGISSKITNNWVREAERLVEEAS